jgi:stearoyl-CoA desaturase (delta-9 desaturase)
MLDFSGMPRTQIAATYITGPFVFYGLYLILADQASAWWLLLSFLVIISISISLSVGYHRLFSHRSFECHKLWHWIFALVGSAACQTSGLIWAHGHRQHHRYADTDNDVYYTNWGIWLGKRFRETEQNLHYVAHLIKDPVHVFTHKYSVLLALGIAAAIYLMFGWHALIFGYLLPTGYAQFIMLFLQQFTHSNVTKAPVSRPYLEFILPIAGEWDHKIHHENPKKYKFGKFDLGGHFIELIRKKTN